MCSTCTGLRPCAATPIWTKNMSMTPIAWYLNTKIIDMPRQPVKAMSTRNAGMSEKQKTCFRRNFSSRFRCPRYDGRQQRIRKGVSVDSRVKRGRRKPDSGAMFCRDGGFVVAHTRSNIQDLSRCLIFLPSLSPDFAIRACSCDDM